MNEYGKVLENIDLKKYNTYGIGGIAKYLISPDSLEHLQGLIKYLNKEKIPWYLLGSGSNVILPDTNFTGAIIKLNYLNSIKINKDIIVANAGITLKDFINNLLDAGFVNYAPLMGIPGTLGGAIVGNAGAYNVAIFDNLISVIVMDEYGNIKEYNKDIIQYGYRMTEFKGHKNIIVAAKFQGIKGNVAKAREQIKENLQKRKNTQPLEYKNAGSVFKNPSVASAGYLIENTGLKNLTVGGAKVSEKHANFIINYNNATSRDIIELITIIKKEVQKQQKVKLELEQIIVTW